MPQNPGQQGIHSPVQVSGGITGRELLDSWGPLLAQVAQPGIAAERFVSSGLYRGLVSSCCVFLGE